MTQRSEPHGLAATSPTTRPSIVTQAAAFRWLAERHLDSSYRLARAIVRDAAAAEDATHDAFEQAWLHWSELRDPARFEQWFCRILVNVCRNHLRRAARARVRDISGEIVTAADEIARVDERQQMGAMLASLSPDHQLVVTLRYYRDMTVDDIAAVLGVRPGTVHSRLHYALKRLAKQIRGDAPGGPSD